MIKPIGNLVFYQWRCGLVHPWVCPFGRSVVTLDVSRLCKQIADWIELKCGWWNYNRATQPDQPLIELINCLLLWSFSALICYRSNYTSCVERASAGALFLWNRDLRRNDTDIWSQSYRELNFLCFFQIITNTMWIEALDFLAYQSTGLSFGEVVMLYLGICHVSQGTQDIKYHKMSLNMTNSTSLTCTTLNSRSNIETAVRCTNDMKCRAVWSSGENKGESRLALCDCMTEPAYGHVVNSQWTLDVKTNGNFEAGELLLCADLRPYMLTSSNGNISASLALCGGNPPMTGGFPSQRPMTWSFDVFFNLRLNNRLSK